MAAKPSSKVTTGGGIVGALITLAIIAKFVSVHNAVDKSGLGLAPVVAETPQRALATFVSGIFDHDVAKIRSASLGDKSDYATVELLSEMWVATNEAQAAEQAKFGKEAVERAHKARATQPTTASSKGLLLVALLEISMVQDLGHMDVQVHGDTADLIDKRHPSASTPAKMVRRDGHWKLDISGLCHQGELIRPLTAVRDAARQIKAEVASGQIKSPGEIDLERRAEAIYTKIPQSNGAK